MRTGLRGGFGLEAAVVRAVKRAEARAPAANPVTMGFVRSSICRIFLGISRGIIFQEGENASRNSAISRRTDREDHPDCKPRFRLWRCF